MKLQLRSRAFSTPIASSYPMLCTLAAAALISLGASQASANGPTRTIDYTGPLGIAELTFEDDRTVASPGIYSGGGRLFYYEGSYYVGGIFVNGSLRTGGAAYYINGGEITSTADWTYCTLIDANTLERIEARIDVNFNDNYPPYSFVDYFKLTTNPLDHDGKREYVFQLYTQPTLPTAATPRISPNGGTFTGPIQVSLACATPGATIYYITNAAATTASVYTGPLTLASSTSISAVAVASGYSNSAVASATFTITPVSSIRLASPTKLANGSFQFSFT